MGNRWRIGVLVAVIGASCGPAWSMDRMAAIEARLLQAEVAAAKAEKLAGDANRNAASISERVNANSQMAAAPQRASGADRSEVAALESRVDRMQKVLEARSGQEASGQVKAQMDALAKQLAKQDSVIADLRAQMAARQQGAAPVQVRSAAQPVASDVCGALKVGNRASWQQALDGYSAGFRFVSLDSRSGVAVIRTADGNEEAIQAKDVLEDRGCS